jgi:hypothetical protein
LQAKQLVVPLHLLKASAEGAMFFQRQKGEDAPRLKDVFVANTYDVGTVNFVSVG